MAYVGFSFRFRRWPGLILSYIQSISIHLHFTEAFKYLLPRIAPQIASELNQTYEAGTTNTTSLLALRAATDLCAVHAQYCVGDNVQYQSWVHALDD